MKPSPGRLRNCLGYENHSPLAPVRPQRGRVLHLAWRQLCALEGMLTNAADLAPGLEAERGEPLAATEGELFDDPNAPGNDKLLEPAATEAHVADALQTRSRLED